MLLFDFEQPGLSDRWELLGAGAVHRSDCAYGACLRVEPRPGMRFVTADVPTDWRSFGSVGVRAWADADVSFDIVLTGPDGGGWRHTVDVPGDACIDAPIDLGWFRRADGPVASWESIGRLTLAFRSEVPLWIDDLEVTTGTPTLSPAAIARVTGGRPVPGTRSVVITDVAEDDARALAAHLDRVEDRVRGDLPWLPAAGGAVPLVVMGDTRAWLAAVHRLAGAFGSSTRTPASGGYTLEGIATSSWDGKQGILRPVYVHEYVHALVSRATGLPNDGSWLQEGLAAWFQSMLLPQDDLARVVRRRIAVGMPLRELCDGRRIGLSNYGEAMAVVGTLLEVPRWSGVLETAVERASQTSSTSLLPLGVDLDALEADRRLWAEARFPL